MPVWVDGRMSDEVSERRLDMDRAATAAAAGVDQNSARTGQLGGCGGGGSSGLLKREREREIQRGGWPRTERYVLQTFRTAHFSAIRGKSHRAQFCRHHNGCIYGSRSSCNEMKRLSETHRIPLPRMGESGEDDAPK